MPNVRLTPTEKLVLGELLKHANYKTWETFVGLKTIAKKTDLAKATVQDAVQNLVKKGAIQHAGQHPTPNGFTNLWRITEHFRVVPAKGMDTGMVGMDSGTVREGMDSSPDTGYGQGMDTGTDLNWIKNLIEEQKQTQEQLRLLSEKIDLLLVRTKHLNSRSDPSNRPTAESPISAAPLCQNACCKNPAGPTGYCSYECEQEDAELNDEMLAQKAGQL